MNRWSGAKSPRRRWWVRWRIASWRAAGGKLLFRHTIRLPAALRPASAVN